MNGGGGRWCGRCLSSRRFFPALHFPPLPTDIIERIFLSGDQGSDQRGAGRDREDCRGALLALAPSPDASPLPCRNGGCGF